MIKKTPMVEYGNVRKNGLQAIVLKDGDELIEVKATDDQQDIFLVTKKGMCIRFKEKDVRTTGRVSMGVIGMRFEEDDEIMGVLCYKITEKTGSLVGAKLVNDGREIMLITTEGIIIRMSVDDISVIGRNTSGVKLMSIDQNSDIKVASIAKVRENETKDSNVYNEEYEDEVQTAEEE